MNKSFLVLLTLLSTLSISAQLSFEEKYFQYYSTGLYSNFGSDFIDYDGDGNLDVLMGYEQRERLLLFKNVGSTFDINTVSDTASGYCYIKRVDLNRDGFDDYLVAEKKSVTGKYDLLLYTNDGSYNYSASFIYQIGYDRIERIDTADLDQDGDVDLIVDRPTNDNFFSVLENLGNGSFVKNQISFLGQPSELYGVADMNADGFPDVVGAYYNFSVTDWIVVVVETDTSLNPPYVIHNIDTLDLSREGVVANFSGSALPDIMVSPSLVSGTGNTNCYYYQNNGNFSFNAPTNPQVIGGAKLYMPNDYDTDGKIDVLAYNGVSLSLLKNMGNGAFNASIVATNTSVPVAWEDANNDGLKDLLCSGGILTQTVAGMYETFWRNDKIGEENLMLFDADKNGKIDILGTSIRTTSTSFQTYDEHILNTKVYEPAGLSSAAGSRYLDVIYFDKDNDGDQDILASKQSGLFWLENNNGTFTGSATTPTFNSPRVFREGDFDGDSNKDILLLGGSSIQYLEWNGNAFTTNAVGIYATQYAVGDVDQDGDEDFLYTKYNSSTTSVDVFVGSNNGSGTFTSQFVVNLGSMLNYSSTNSESTMQAGDYDSDGDMDFFLLSYTQGKVILLRNDSNNVITPSVFGTIATPNHVVVADLDGDADNDVIITSFTTGAVTFYQNDGSQNFTASSLTDEGYNITGIEVLDFDVDGDLDVFIGTPFYLLLKNTAIHCPRSYSNGTDSLCVNDSLLISGTYYHAPALANDSLLTVNGCDSIHQLELFLIPFQNVSILQDSSYNLFAPTGLLNYQWYRNDTLLAGETTNSLQTLLYGDGSYYVSITNTQGCELFSNIIIVQTSHIGIDESVIIDITLYPNPTSGILYIDSQKHIEKIDVFDINGRVLISVKNPGKQIDLSPLNAGMYFVKIHVDGRNLVKTVVRQ